MADASLDHSSIAYRGGPAGALLKIQLGENAFATGGLLATIRRSHLSWIEFTVTVTNRLARSQ